MSEGAIGPRDGASAGAPSPRRAFRLADLRGETADASPPAEPAGFEAALRRLVDPAAARRTIAWGRNYLFAADWDAAGAAPRGEVVVKLFRHDRWRARLDRWRRGSKAQRSFDTAFALRRAGVATPAPVLWAESLDPRGPAWYVCESLPPGAFELRYFLRARNAGREAEEFPGVDAPRLIDALGTMAARLHAAGIWHRDWTAGNIFVQWNPAGEPRLWLIDLNRARHPVALSMAARAREIGRLPVLREDDRERLLAAYHGRNPSSAERALYRVCHHGFLGKNRVKGIVRFWRRPAAGLKPRVRGGGFWRRRTAHAHIPPPAGGAPPRERSVWDPLSAQPHQHAGRLSRLAIRLADLPAHAVDVGRVVTILPACRGEYRRLRGRLEEDPPWVEWPGLGIALRAGPLPREALLEAIGALGAARVLLRLHPWEEGADADEGLAGDLAGGGCEVAFALPQNRDLVRDPGRWRAFLERAADRLGVAGRWFQVGQAINRSKWGVWTLDEYARLFAAAAATLGRRPGVLLAGPAVIDFEFHALAAALARLDRDGLAVDIVSALLYVDRRGRPEARQLGFDLVDKVTLLAALARAAPGVRPPVPSSAPARTWISEVNWPLREGPHSPAGQSVAVSEPVQADYWARYALAAYSTGLVERIDWWQLVAPGYGLIDPRGERWRRRPSFEAFRALERWLRGARLRRSAAPPGERRLEVRLRDGRRGAIHWRADGGSAPSPYAPARVEAVIALGARAGAEPPPAVLDGEPRLFILPD